MKLSNGIAEKNRQGSLQFYKGEIAMKRGRESRLLALCLANVIVLNFLFLTNAGPQNLEAEIKAPLAIQGPRALGQALREDAPDTVFFHLDTDILSSPIARGKVALNTSVDLSSYLPPVGNQVWGDCAAWAIGYYYKTFQEKKKRGWDVSLPEHQFSPSFLYNQCNGGVSQGIFISSAFMVLLQQGCASLATFPYTTFPYNSDDCSAWPSQQAYLEAMQYRVAELLYLPEDYTQNGVNALRQLLLEDEMAVFGIAIYDNFLRINASDPNYCLPSLADSVLYFYHAVAVVGFDDLRTTTDGRGAFKCVNSAGNSWGDAGYFWISYELFKSWRAGHTGLYYARNETNYVPRLITNVNLSHDRSGTVHFSVLLGDTSAPILIKEWNPWFVSVSIRSGVNLIDILRPFPNYDLPVDITEFVPYLSATPQSIVVKIEDFELDSHTGSVNRACVQWLGNPLPFLCSSDVPRSIPDQGTLFLPIEGEVPTLVEDQEEGAVPKAFVLSQNYPNPFNPATEIAFSLPENSHVTLTVFNALGQKVATLVDEKRGAGSYRVRWDGTGFPSGVYFYRLETGGFSKTMKMLLMK